MILHAAIKRGNVIYVGRRHHDVIKTMNACGVSPKGEEAVQGFVDDEGRFLDRKEAYRVAVASGQIERGTNPGTLFSEDLY